MARRAKGWTAVQGEYVMCPVPECKHIGLAITKIHCRMVHDMERSEIEKLYGEAYRVLKKRKGRVINDREI